MARSEISVSKELGVFTLKTQLDAGPECQTKGVGGCEDIFGISQNSHSLRIIYHVVNGLQIGNFIFDLMLYKLYFHALNI